MPEAAAPCRIEAIRLVRIGTLAPGLLETIAARLSRRIALPCTIDPRPFRADLPRLAGRPGQIDADRLLRRLQENGAAGGTVRVGLTEHDLGIPIFTFVFGRARRYGHAALVSLARLDPVFYGLRPDPDLTHRRIVEEVLHELGHVAGLRHCDDFGCRMRFAGTAEAVDLRRPRFCSGCRGRLPDGLAMGNDGA